MCVYTRSYMCNNTHIFKRLILGSNSLLLNKEKKTLVDGIKNSRNSYKNVILTPPFTYFAVRS